MKKRYAACMVIFFSSVALSVILLAWARSDAHSVETIYARTIFPFVKGATSWLAAMLPFSLAEMLLILIVIALLALICLTIYSLVKRRKEAIIAITLTTLAVAGVMWFSFYALWGLNYYRQTLYQSLGLENVKHSKEQLYELCLLLQRQADEAREKLPINPDGTAQLPDYKKALKSVPGVYKNLGKQFKLFDSPVSVPKAVMLSAPLSHTGISGIYIPYTQEANVNIDQYPLLLAATACHEAAHGIGFAREDEANFIAYLGCLYSEDPVFEYSGAMLALIYASNALYKVDPDTYKLLRKDYTSGMESDLISYQSYWEAREGEVSRAASDVNDKYLKANGQPSGMSSYGDMVDLMLASIDAGIIK